MRSIVLKIRSVVHTVMCTVLTIKCRYKDEKDLLSLDNVRIHIGVSCER